MGNLLKSIQSRKNNFLMSFIFLNLLKKNKYSEFLPIIGFFYILTHVVACIWHLLATNSNDHQSWIYRTGYINYGHLDRYFASLYFVYQTVLKFLTFSRLLQ